MQPLPTTTISPIPITVTNVGAMPGSDAFLITTQERTMLIDSGFSFCAQNLIENINKELKGRKLDFCLLTHSHYDHASGSAYLRPHFPQVEIIASTYTGKILGKPSAVEVMRQMNQAAAKEYGQREREDHLDHLKVDRMVEEGDIISLGDLDMKILSAPGHTNCSIAAYMPKERFLIACETMGVYVGGSLVAPCFLVSYKKSMEFIQRVMNLDPEHILVPHYGVVSGTDCRRYMTDAWRCSQRLKDLIVEEQEKGSDYEAILACYKREFYVEELQRVQPEKAFDLNASYLIPMVLKEAFSL